MPSADLTAIDYLARARDLAPSIEGWAERNEHEGRLCEPLLDALHESGVYRLLLPRSLDGGEADPPAFVRVLTDWSPSFQGLFLYYPSRRQIPAALRAFIDMIHMADPSAGNRPAELPA